MRIAYIVPGTGGAFYCENCIRDYALIGGLQALGHEVVVVPLYLPPTDAEKVAAQTAPLFFGAVRLYLQHKSPKLRRLSYRTLQFLDHPVLLRLAASQAGSTRAEGHEELTLSMLRGPEGNAGAEFERLARWLTRSVAPEAVFISNTLLLGVGTALKGHSTTPVVCLAQDEHVWVQSSSPDYRSELWGALSAACRSADVLLTLSAWYRDKAASDMHIPPERIGVIPFGVDPARYHVTPAQNAAPVMGFLSRLCQANGLGTTVEAYRILRSDYPNLSLRLFGGYTRDDQPFLKECLKELSFRPVTYSRQSSYKDRAAFLSSLSFLSVPLGADAALGTFMVEAMASGVAVVQPDKGGFRELIRATGGGILFSPTTAAALADAARPLIEDPALRHALGKRGREAVEGHFNHLTMARSAIDHLESALASHPARSTRQRSRSHAL